MRCKLINGDEIEYVNVKDLSDVIEITFSGDREKFSSIKWTKMKNLEIINFNDSRLSDCTFPPLPSVKNIKLVDSFFDATTLASLINTIIEPNSAKFELGDKSKTPFLKWLFSVGDARDSDSGSENFFDSQSSLDDTVQFESSTKSSTFSESESESSYDLVISINDSDSPSSNSKSLGSISGSNSYGSGRSNSGSTSRSASGTSFSVSDQESLGLNHYTVEVLNKALFFLDDKDKVIPVKNIKTNILTAYNKLKSAFPFNCNSEFLNFLKPTNHLSDDAFLHLVRYFSSLQITQEYQPFGTFEFKNLASSNFTEEMLEMEFPNTKSQLQRVFEPNQEDPFVTVQKICADGDCYYRAVMRAHIENIILCVDLRTKKQYLERLLGMLNDYVLEGRFFKQLAGDDHKSVNYFLVQLKQLMSSNDSGALCRFESLLADESFDQGLVLAARYLCGEFIFQVRDEISPEDKEILIRDSFPLLALETTETQDYDAAINSIETNSELIDVEILKDQIKQERDEKFREKIETQILTKGEYAEGDLITKQLLPSLLGAQVALLSLDENISKQKSLTEGLEAGAMPVISLLHHGDHIDFLRTESNCLKRDQAYLSQSYQESADNGIELQTVSEISLTSTDSSATEILNSNDQSVVPVSSVHNRGSNIRQRLFGQLSSKNPGQIYPQYLKSQDYTSTSVNIIGGEPHKRREQTSQKQIGPACYHQTPKLDFIANSNGQESERSLEAIKQNIGTGLKEIKKSANNKFKIDEKNYQSVTLSYQRSDSSAKIPLLEACSASVKVFKSLATLDDGVLEMNEKAMIVLASLGIPPCPLEGINIDGKGKGSALAECIHAIFDRHFYKQYQLENTNSPLYHGPYQAHP